MKTLFISLAIFLLVMVFIPVGGMHVSNPNHNVYIYSFMGGEIFVFIALIRIAINNKLKK